MIFIKDVFLSSDLEFIGVTPVVGDKGTLLSKEFWLEPSKSHKKWLSALFYIFFHTRPLPVAASRSYQ